MGAHHDAQLACDALDAAVATRGGQPMDGGTIFHTDRGAEGVHLWRLHRCLPAAGASRRSMSRTGSCLDNAVAESWFAS